MFGSQGGTLQEEKRVPRFALQKRSLHALEMIESVAKPHTTPDELGFGLVEQQVCELAVAAKNLGHVWFVGELRVHLCPVMGRPNEGEIGHEELERGVASRRTHSGAGVGAVARRQEHDCQCVEEIEQRRQRAVQRRRLCKLPEFLDQPRRRVSGTEKIREDAEAIGDLRPEPKSPRL